MGEALRPRGGHYEPKSSRVGPGFQVHDVPELGGGTLKWEDTLLWSPHNIDVKEMNRYMNEIQLLFRNTGPFSEEKALHFLHRCNYDVDCALRILAPSSFSPPKSEPETVAAPVEPVPVEQPAQEEDDFCFLCKDGGELMLCDVVGCDKVYHMSCVGLGQVPEGTWQCPHHFCSACKQEAPPQLMCANCPLSYCFSHVSAQLKRSNYAGMSLFLCDLCCIGFKQLPEPASVINLAEEFKLHLEEFYARQGKKASLAHIVGGVNVNLYLLYKYVISLDGHRQVSRRNVWDILAWAIGIPKQTLHSGNQLRQFYLKLLAPYESSFRK